MTQIAEKPAQPIARSDLITAPAPKYPTSAPIIASPKIAAMIGMTFMSSPAARLAKSRRRRDGLPEHINSDFQQWTLTLPPKNASVPMEHFDETTLARQRLTLASQSWLDPINGCARG